MATSSSVSGQAAQLRLAVTRTARRLRQEAGTGLSPTLTAALATVERHGPLTPSELAARERVQRPTATRLVARLEADGLVVRMSDPQDRRAPLITPSPGGRGGPRPAPPPQDPFLAERARPPPGRGRAPPPPAPAGPFSWGGGGAGGGRRIAPRSRAPRCCWSRCSRSGGRSARDDRAAPGAQVPRGPQLPPLLRRTGRLHLRQLDADGGRDV